MKVKLLSNEAKVPTKANISDAGFDLYCVENYIIPHGRIMQVKTGIVVEIPFGCVGIIKDRSSKAIQGLHILGGVIDSGYIGEIIIIMINLSAKYIEINHNDKIAQLIIFPLTPIANLQIVDELVETVRGEKGFGSSDE